MSSRHYPNHCGRSQSTGFTLTELAVVLVIVGLLLSTLMPALSAQLDQRNYSETRQTLSEVREALIGFAAKSAAADGKPYLPCPDTNDDGVEDRGAGGACIGYEGYLPWSDLGLARTDSWNNRVRYRVHASFSSNITGFTLLTADPDLRVLVAGGGITIATKLPVTLVSHGKNGLGARNTLPGWNTAPTGTDELENTDNDTDYVSHEQAPDFDDIVVWLPVPLLNSRMISAGRLP